MARMIRAIFFIAILVSLALRARADEVIFNNGDRVSGDVTWSADGREVTIRNSVLGTVTAKAADVRSVTATRPATAAAATHPTTVAATTLRIVRDRRRQ